MARKPKARLHPDVAAALPVALAALDDAPARRGGKARANAFLPVLPPPGRGDMGPGGVGGDAANGAVPAKALRRPKRPAAAAPENPAPKRRGPQRRTPQPHGAPELVNAAPGREAGPQPAGVASTDPVPMDVSAAAGDDMQPPLPGLHAPSPVQPAAHWDRATDAMRFNWPVIERTAAADGPNQGMAKLLLAARAEGANSRWPL